MCIFIIQIVKFFIYQKYTENILGIYRKYTAPNKEAKNFGSVALRNYPC